MNKEKTLEEIKSERKDVRTEKAHALLEAAQKNESENIIYKGFALSILRENKSWQQFLPESSWAQFLHYWGFNSMKANRYIYAYETFVEKFGVPLSEIAQIRYHSRLYTSLRDLERGGVLNKHNVREWLTKARELPPPEWEDEIQETQGELCYHQDTKTVIQETEVCTNCGASVSSKKYDQEKRQS